MIDPNGTQSRRDAPHTFHADVVTVADHDQTASGESFEFAVDRAITTAERGDDADVAQDSGAVGKLKRGQRVFASLDDEDHVAPVALDHVTQTNELMPVRAFIVRAFELFPIQPARRAIV